MQLPPLHLAEWRGVQERVQCYKERSCKLSSDKERRESFFPKRGRMNGKLIIVEQTTNK